MMIAKHGLPREAVSVFSGMPNAWEKARLLRW